MNAIEAVDRLNKGDVLFIRNKHIFDFMREVEKHTTNIDLIFRVNKKKRGITEISLSDKPLLNNTIEITKNKIKL